MGGRRRIWVVTAGLAMALGSALIWAPKTLQVAATCVTNHGTRASSVVYGGEIQEFSYGDCAKVLEHFWFDGSVWHHETLDGTGSAYAGPSSGATTDNVGLYASPVVYKGQLHVFYADASNPRLGLRHAWWDGVTWHFETLDGEGNAYAASGATSHILGQYNSAVVYNGQLQDFNFDASNPKSLRHEWWDGSHWSFEWVDGGGSTYPGHTTDSVGQYNSAIVYSGQVHEFTFDATSQAQRHLWFDGGAWHFEVLDGSGSAYPGHTSSDQVGYYTGAAIYKGQLQDFNQDVTTNALRHAWWDGVTWRIETLDGAGSSYSGATTDVVGGTSSAVSYNGQLHEFNWDLSANAARHLWWDGANWHFETVDGMGSPYTGHTTDHVGLYNSALVYTTQLEDFNRDDTSGELNLERWDGASWHFLQLP